MTQTLEYIDGVLGLPSFVVNSPEVLAATIMSTTETNGMGVQIPILRHEDEPDSRHINRVCAVVSYALDKLGHCNKGITVEFVFDEQTADIDGINLRGVRED